MEEKKESTKKVENKNISLNESIIKIRVKLQSYNLKKSGKNEFARFEYFELADFLPKLNELMEEEGINDIFTINENVAKLTLIKGEESQEYTLPFYRFETPLNFKKDKNGNFMKDDNGNYLEVKSMQDIQYLGALNTYYKRYLYLNAFGITDGEIIDSMDNSELEDNKKVVKTKEELKIQKSQIEIISRFYKEENLEKLLKNNNLKKLEDMSLVKAIEICKELNKKLEEKENGNS